MSYLMAGLPNLENKIELCPPLPSLYCYREVINVDNP